MFHKFYYDSKGIKSPFFVKDDGMVDIRTIHRDDRTSSMYENAIEHQYILHLVSRKLITLPMCWSSVNRNPDSIRFVPRSFLSWHLVVFALMYKPRNVRTKNVIFMFKSATLKEIVELIQKVDVLKWLPQNLKTRLLCVLSVRSNPEMIRYVPKHLLSREMCQYAFKHDKKLIVYFPAKYATEDMCVEVLHEMKDEKQHNGDEPHDFEFEMLTYIATRIIPGSNVEFTHLVIMMFDFLLFLKHDSLSQLTCDLSVRLYPRSIRFVPKDFITHEMCHLFTAAYSPPLGFTRLTPEDCKGVVECRYPLLSYLYDDSYSTRYYENFNPHLAYSALMMYMHPTGHPIYDTLLNEETIIGLSNEELCVVCAGRMRDTVLKPCNHDVICSMCAQLWYSRNPPNCVYCQCVITSFEPKPVR